MKYYSFANLSNVSQIKACYEYAVGWKETHPDEDLNFLQVYGMLRFISGENYSEDGTFQEEN